MERGCLGVELELHSILAELVLIYKKVVRCVPQDSVALQATLRKVLGVQSDDRICASMHGRAEHMAVVGIGYTREASLQIMWDGNRGLGERLTHCGDTPMGLSIRTSQFCRQHARDFLKNAIAP